MYLYMLVTEDKYELPVAVFDTAEQLANFVGLSKNTIYSSLSKAKSGKRKKCRFVQVKIKE